MPATDASFGYLLPTREMVMAQSSPDIGQLIGLAKQAEQLGFDSVWVGDSVLSRPRFEALTTLAAIASRTQRVKLGTAVFLPALRNPVVLANEVANLDMLADGRLILGVGIGTKSPMNEREFAACGVPFARRIGIFEETLTIMRRLWSEPEVTFAGRHFQLEGVKLGLRPVQQPGVPMWMAASVERGQSRLVRLGDGWMPNPTSHEVFAEGWQRIQKMSREAGRDAETLHRCVYTTLNINDDPTQAENEMRTFFENYYGAPYETMARSQSMCAGSVQKCADWIRGFLSVGAQTVIVRFGGPDQIQQLERCSKEVLPQVRAS